MSAPVEGGTEVAVQGSSFYPSPTLGVRISIYPPKAKSTATPNTSEDDPESSEMPTPLTQVCIPATFVSAKSMTFIVPKDGLLTDQVIISQTEA